MVESEWISLAGFLVVVAGGIGSYYRSMEKLAEMKAEFDRHMVIWENFQKEHKDLLREVSENTGQNRAVLEAMDRRLDELERRRTR